MKIDSGLIAADLASVPERARDLEAQGFDGVHARVLHHVRVSGDAPVVPARP